MKTLPEQLPDNIALFRIGKWRVDHLDQEMMRKLRQIANKLGSTIQEVMDRAILNFGEHCIAESELQMKIIPFPVQSRPNLDSSSGYSQAGASLRSHEIAGGGQTTIFGLLEESRQLHESLSFNTAKLKALIRGSQHRRQQLRRVLGQRQAAR